MKTRNIFDHMDNEPAELDEQTVLEETGVKTERVKEIFNEMAKNNGSKKNKRRITKVFTVLAAAVAATLAIGTITAGATGSFNSVFGQMFAGEADNGMFSGGNVNANSDTLDIDFKGVTGDSNDAYGIMDITNKDGSDFISDPSCEFVYSIIDDDASEVSCTRSLFDHISSKLYYRHDGGCGSVEYYAKDNKTIEAVFEYSDSEFNIIGQTLNISNEVIKIAHIDKVLYSWNEIIENSKAREKDPSLDKEWTKWWDETEASLKEGQQIIYDRDFNLVIATIKTVPFKYNLSVALNYRDLSKTFDVKGMESKFSGNDVTLDSLIVRPFSAELNMTYHVSDIDELYELWTAECSESENVLTITMKNGSVYTSDRYPDYTSDNHRRLTFTFYDGNFNKVVMNPSDIKSIDYNGTTLYSE